MAFGWLVIRSQRGCGRGGIRNIRTARESKIKLFFSVVLSLFCCLAVEAKPKAKAKAKAKEVSFETWSYTGREIYPSALISTATVDWNTDEEDEEAEVGTYGDENGWLGIVLYDAPAGAKVTVEITADGGWLKPSKLSIVTGDDDEEVMVIPKGIYDYDALHQIRQQKPVNVTTKVTVNDVVLDEVTETMILRSVNECPFAVLFVDDGPPEDVSWLFAGYVNENHPWIDGLLKEALTTGLVDSFDGYQSGDPDKVIAQVFAIWNTLQRRGLKYSDITASPPSKYVAAQVVRFLDDSIENKQANCVDGTVLMASILTKISINAHLVLVPGHCYLAFDLAPNDEEGETTLGLETTMLGNKTLKPLEDLSKLPQKARDKVHGKEQQESFNTFANAIGHGSSDLEANLEKFGDEENPQYVFVSIKEARQFGIMPIASAKK